MLNICCYQIGLYDYPQLSTSVCTQNVINSAQPDWEHRCKKELVSYMWAFLNALALYITEHASQHGERETLTSCLHWLQEAHKYVG